MARLGGAETWGRAAEKAAKKGNGRNKKTVTIVGLYQSIWRNQTRPWASYILSESALLSLIKIFPGRLYLRLHPYALVLVLSHLCEQGRHLVFRAPIDFCPVLIRNCQIFYEERLCRRTPPAPYLSSVLGDWGT